MTEARTQNIRNSWVVPTYRSLMIHYDPLKTTYQELVESLRQLEDKLESIQLPAPEVMKFPPCMEVMGQILKMWQTTMDSL